MQKLILIACCVIQMAFSRVTSYGVYKTGEPMDVAGGWKVAVPDDYAAYEEDHRKNTCITGNMRNSIISRRIWLPRCKSMCDKDPRCVGFKYKTPGKLVRKRVYYLGGECTTFAYMRNPGRCSRPRKQFVVLGSCSKSAFFIKREVLGEKKKVAVSPLSKGTHRRVGHAQEIDNGGWQLVRRVEQGEKWHPTKDQLRGTDAYGTRCGESGNCTFSVDWSADPFDEFLFSSGDRKYWLITKKNQALGWYTDKSRKIVKSSITSHAYHARWYRRKSRLEDPWIGLKDHGRVYSHKNEVNILYGENSVTVHNNVLKHGGANVYIRDSKYWTGEGVLPKLSKKYDAECKICISDSCKKKCQHHHEHSKLFSTWSKKEEVARKALSDANAKKTRYEADLKEATTRAKFHARKEKEWKAAMDAQHKYDLALESLSQEEAELKEAETAAKEAKTKKEQDAAALAASQIRLKIATDERIAAEKKVKLLDTQLKQIDNELGAHSKALKDLTREKNKLQIEIRKVSQDLSKHKGKQSKLLNEVTKHQASVKKHASLESKHKERASERRRASKRKGAETETLRRKAQKTHYPAKGV